MINISLLSMLLASATIQADVLHDFDHGINYEQVKLSKNEYQLDISSGSYQLFKQQSVFLLRYSSQLCNKQNFTLEVLSGVQKFDAFPTTPRALQSNLKVIVTCEQSPS
ncbi:hypothetical protein CJF42_14100 [Pseudoalteromonas sp. NBT06-2]|uniref:hypothetical protein n=1 Tax=Pseudoalteromonas sp. NBT06-2 TaxID=2025950 RepID=UPI000BA58686|nr:hypothetical protein [Pseudoalteromonas sp. NBT06-2]PAJ73774.1 hypothetical protein CJF42_14100 [Pseudoalteromonas sp. NBT06-2]